MKKYKFRQHIDSYIEKVIEAEDEDKGNELFDLWSQGDEADSQITSNSEPGETNVEDLGDA